MKRSLITSGAIVAGLAMTVATADEPASPATPKVEIRDASSHEELANRLRQAQSNDPLSNFKTSESGDPAKNQQPVDILEISDILSYNGLTTLVPKRAILALPANLRNRVGKHHPGHRVVTWEEFYQANRAWITTIEVSRAQAEGGQPLSEADAEGVTKATRLIVATLQGGPISVLPVKPPEEDAGQANGEER